MTHTYCKYPLVAFQLAESTKMFFTPVKAVAKSIPSFSSNLSMKNPEERNLIHPAY